MATPDKQALRKQLGDALKRLRERRGLTFEEVAARMGKSPTAGPQIFRWENGEATPLSDNLWLFLLAVDATFADLHRELNPAPEKSERLSEIVKELQALAESSAR